jgi:sec-independent protein translocase protein TatC
MTSPPQGEMPFLDHLEELRWRILKIVIALVIGVGISFTILFSGSFDIITVLARPIAPYIPGGTLMVTGPSDSFNIIMQASIGLGIVMASPVIAWQIWGFLSPAMYKHEKKTVIPVLIGAAILFLAGMALAFYLVVPTSLRFLLTAFKSKSVINMMTVDSYFSFLFSMCLTFGIVFELPIVILLLTAIGIVNPSFLKKFRRHAFVACLAAAALITPGQDPWSLFMLTIPLYVLYEMSIVLSVGVFKNRQKKIAIEEANEALERLG